LPGFFNQLNVSIYLRNVAQVQAARAAASNSLGANPLFCPPFSTGSSAITTLPVGDLISILYSSVPILALTAAMFLFFIE
jgi:hypothetical protein